MSTQDKNPNPDKQNFLTSDTGSSEILAEAQEQSPSSPETNPSKNESLDIHSESLGTAGGPPEPHSRQIHYWRKDLNYKLIGLLMSS